MVHLLHVVPKGESREEIEGETAGAKKNLGDIKPLLNARDFALKHTPVPEGFAMPLSLLQRRWISPRSLYGKEGIFEEHLFWNHGL
jgi:hypothetical protein